MALAGCQRSAGGRNRDVSPNFHAITLRPLQEQPRCTFGEGSDREGRVDAEGGRHACPIRHEDAWMTAQLVPVVARGQLRVVTDPA